ncbi:hypothetical protein ACFSVM_05845 [Paenibacillus shunpengii]|uniref:DUF86 domain-containing protein n=1 Tax=Paenibacillus shunpengii TaxID=2054424 RepID=A0ABW5SJS6_9BACL|nr:MULTISPECIES: hypothetical protein [unclassified Paenibacillus]OMC71199.1 hypothetical protein BK126_03570 [Paenibacillus sp. FSL H7-0326]SDW19447.1 hypothetical protein SAMN05518848_101600 [Paenibacillus sp. PDC88]
MTSEMLPEEHTLIKSYLQLLMVIKIFNRDLQVMSSHAGLKTPELYMEIIRAGIARVAVLLEEVEEEFRRMDIHLNRVNLYDGEIQALASIRGHHVHIHIPWTIYKDELYKRMQIYLGGIPLIL